MNNQLTKHESADRQWFALSGIDGKLYALGDCGDYDAADEVAYDLGVDAVWIVDAEQAREFKAVIESRGL